MSMKSFLPALLLVCALPACGDLEDGDSNFSAMERQMLQEVNLVRAKGTTCGTKKMNPTTPLKLVGALNAASASHSQDMADKNYFSHTGKDGSSPSKRAQRAGYDGRGVGENIAAGRATVAEVMDQWLKSPGHCTNIMRPSYSEFGIGYAQVPGSTYRHYWTQMFGS